MLIQVEAMEKVRTYVRACRTQRPEDNPDTKVLLKACIEPSGVLLEITLGDLAALVGENTGHPSSANTTN